MQLYRLKATPLGRSKRNGSFLSYVLEAVALSCAIGTLVVLAAFSLLGWRINSSASMPLGIYRITNDAESRIVAFCPTGESSRESVDRQYRAPGRCPDGDAPIVKSIVATEGDEVDVTETGLMINKVALPNTAPHLLDRAGRKLKPFPEGHYIVDPGYVWVASSFNELSYDSRYYGPIQTHQILYRLQSLVTIGAR
jgi:conjugative transfer signal peptidase TraF